MTDSAVRPVLPAGTRRLRGVVALAAVTALAAGLVANAPTAVAAPKGTIGNGVFAVTTSPVAPGGTITVTGSGFDQRPADTGFLAFKINDGDIAFGADQPDGETSGGAVYVTDAAKLPDADGAFSVQLKLPADLAESTSDETYWIRVLSGTDGGSAISKFDYFTVDAPSTSGAASVSKVSVAATGAVTLSISGSGYTAASTVALTYADAAVQWTGSKDTLTVADDGTFSGTTTLAAGTALAGDHTITLTGSDDAAKQLSFTTTPVTAFSANPGVNATITVTAVNLPANGTVTSLGTSGKNWLAANGTSDASGNATLADVKVPADAPVGASISLGYNDGSARSYDTGKVVTPDDTLRNADDFTVSEKVLAGGLYQSATNPTTGKTFTTAAVGRPPILDSTLTKLDATTLEIEKTVLPAAVDSADATKGVYGVYGIALYNAGNQVWVSNTRQNTVAVYSQDDLSLVKQFPDSLTGHSRDLAVDETTGLVYVSSADRSASGNGYIDVYNANTLANPQRIELGTDAEPFQVTMSLDLDQATGKLYTVSLTNERAAIVDTRNGNAVTYYSLGDNASSPSGVAFDPGTKRLFVANQATNNVVVLDTTNGNILADIPTGVGALNTAFDPTFGYVYVANRSSATITVIDATTLTTVANLAGGTNVNHVEVGADGAVYAVNKKANDTNGNATNSILRIVPNVEVPAAENLTRPTLSGTVKVGKTLRASNGTWGYAADATFSYEWLRNGAVIAGATASSYTLTADDAGRGVQVRVMATVADKATVVTSKEVQVGRLSSTTSAKYSADVKKKGSQGTVAVTVKVAGVASPTGTVKVYDGSKVIATAVLGSSDSGKVTITLPALKKGSHTLKVTYAGNVGITADSSSKYKVTVK
ncbi:MAG: Ig-like domain repeat protein [Propionicimonas sp.]|uniref:Ig-like domain repeat protein n=1 Tax=Propionicimonas sp. TaxID=1955623 RepID=UPI003D11FE2C